MIPLFSSITRLLKVSHSLKNCQVRTISCVYMTDNKIKVVNATNRLIETVTEKATIMATPSYYILLFITLARLPYKASIS